MTVNLHGISQAAFDLIVECEVSSKATYDKKYRKPTKPGAASGITIGIGYDCGYSTAAQIKSDWGGLISDKMISALQNVAGLTKDAAAVKLSSVQSVDVPWEAALSVFSNTSIPKYLKMTNLPNFDALSPDCKGALLSLVYNRGASFRTAGDRYREMRNIYDLMTSKKFSSIPAELRSMKRLWTTPDVLGVAIRRDREADLFAKGLKSPVVEVVDQAPPVPPTPPPAPPAPRPASPPNWAAFLMAIVKTLTGKK